ncbi:MAG: SRPBCC family protein [Chloroflexi bacterium]|nr:SRPBCC family protein [Chloroflexota bacterium]
MDKKQSRGLFNFWLPLMGLLYGLYHVLVRPRFLRWGALAAEINRPMNGDPLIPRPNLEATRAIDINATPETVWAWLMQMGRERTGFYGIDRIDNWGIPSATYLRRDLPALTVGTTLDNGLKVFDINSHDLHLLMGVFDRPHELGGNIDLTYLYSLERTANGSTRLIVRMRGYTDGTGAWFYNRFFEVMDYVMGQTQLKGIKARAEAYQPPIPMPIPFDQYDRPIQSWN